MKRTLGVGVALLALLVVLVGPAAAQYAEPATLSSSDGSGCTPGGPVTLTVTGAVPGTDVTFIMQPDPVVLGIATADANGVAVLQTTWPVNSGLGAHVVIAQGLDGDPNGAIPLDLSISVTCAAVDGEPLARTGSDSLPWAQLGVVLLAVGGLVLLAAKRRRAVVEERV